MSESKISAPPLQPWAKAALDTMWKETPFGQAVMNPAATNNALADYLVDAGQRALLFLDILRERGNEQADMTSRPLATVLTFNHEILLSPSYSPLMRT